MKKSKNQETKMHQHKDLYGQICGMAHPVDAVHKNLETRKRHLDTIAGKTIIRTVIKKKEVSYNIEDAKNLKKIHNIDMEKEIAKIIS